MRPSAEAKRRLMLVIRTPRTMWKKNQTSFLYNLPTLIYFITATTTKTEQCRTPCLFMVPSHIARGMGMWSTRHCGSDISLLRLGYNLCRSILHTLPLAFPPFYISLSYISSHFFLKGQTAPQGSLGGKEPRLPSNIHRSGDFLPKATQLSHLRSRAPPPQQAVRDLKPWQTE